MKVNKPGRKSLKKTVLAAAAAVGAITFLFQGFTQVMVAAEIGKTDKIPTSYTNYTTGSSQVTQSNLLEGYKKANYKVGTIDLEYYRNQKPTSKDMTKENAAEIGAQDLWKIFDLNLEGQVIEMGYQPSAEKFPRSSWYADVLIDGKLSYCFSVDSVTGELFSIGRSRTLKENVSVAFDAALDKNPQEYVALAEKLAKKYNVVHSAVKSVKYNCQGYSDNDPDISVDIAGENGEIALMTFSRYDKVLLGIAYNSLYKPSLENAEKYREEMQKKAEEIKKSNPPADENEVPSLKVLQ